MISERAGSSQSQRIESANESRAREVSRREKEPAKPTPEEARAESIARREKSAPKTLGNRIDTYA